MMTNYTKSEENIELTTGTPYVIRLLQIIRNSFPLNITSNERKVDKSDWCSNCCALEHLKCLVPL